MGEFKVIAFVRMIQARNIACHVEFKDFDSESSEPLKCIYDRNGDNLFTTRAIGGVLHHSTTPDFTEEVTLAAPALLFSFNSKLKSFVFYLSGQNSASGAASRATSRGVYVLSREL